MCNDRQAVRQHSFLVFHCLRGRLRRLQKHKTHQKSCCKTHRFLPAKYSLDRDKQPRESPSLDEGSKKSRRVRVLSMSVNEFCGEPQSNPEQYHQMDDQDEKGVLSVEDKCRPWQPMRQRGSASGARARPLSIADREVSERVRQSRKVEMPRRQ